MPKLFGNSCKYAKIATFGFIAFFSVYGIYSFISNVDEVSVDKAYPKGIDCISLGIIDEQYCKNMAKQMANSTQENTQWACSSYTDYSSTNLYDNLTMFRNLLYPLFAFSAMLNFFAIIHDWVLILKRDNLQNLKLFPPKTDEFYSYYIINKCN
eukprot:277053_1